MNLLRKIAEKQISIFLLIKLEIPETAAPLLKPHNKQFGKRCINTGPVNTCLLLRPYKNNLSI
jgi:hypothetical protein